MDFANDLKRAMGSMSISELSRRSSIPISTVWRHLHDEHQPTLGALEKYEAALPKLKRSRGGRRR